MTPILLRLTPALFLVWVVTVLTLASTEAQLAVGMEWLTLTNRKDAMMQMNTLKMVAPRFVWLKGPICAKVNPHCVLNLVRMAFTISLKNVMTITLWQEMGVITVSKKKDMNVLTTPRTFQFALMLVILDLRLTSKLANHAKRQKKQLDSKEVSILHLKV